MTKQIKETLMASDYITYVVKKSKIDPSKTIRDHEVFNCPKCKTEAKGVGQHGVQFMCKNCGMIMTVWGDALECTL